MAAYRTGLGPGFAVETRREADPAADAPLAASVPTLRQNHATFTALVAEAERLVAARAWEAAAGATKRAAGHAAAWPCGLFASHRLESCIARIGQQIALRERPGAGHRTRAGRSPIERVLHVVSQVRMPGGLGFMLTRWLRSDDGHEHWLALTSQRRRLPSDLEDLIAARGGQIRFPGEHPGGIVAIARSLRALARSFDLIVLHIDCDDVAACMAFAERSDLPPVAFLDHSDHVFWLGVRASDLLISLRRSGAGLAVQRRGFSPAQIAFLPIPLDKRSRAEARSVAKQNLGLRPDSVVMLSIARRVKFCTVNDSRYVDMFVPVLERCPEAVLLLVGPGERADWRAGLEHLTPRIRLHPETLDKERFVDAADIYVDSFPFVSTTSLLEGGLHGNPVVTRHIHPGGGSVLDSDMPGVEDTIIRVEDQQSLTESLLSMVADKANRRRLGARTAAGIERLHHSPTWQAQLEAVYERARVGPHREPADPIPDEPRFELLDRLLPAVIRASAAPPRRPTVTELVLSTLPGWLICALSRRFRS